MNELIAVLTTVGSADDARRIARGLVERRLAACVHVDEIESFYTWDGALQQDREYRLLCKTTADRYAAVEAAIRDLHTYELPAIYAVPLERVFAPYAQWVADNSAAS